MKKKVVISVVLVILSVIAIFGVTYSYFTNKMVGEAGKINVKVADGIISISETEISISNAVPILDETKETKASINEFNITLNEEASVGNRKLKYPIGLMTADEVQ